MLDKTRQSVERAKLKSERRHAALLHLNRRIRMLGALIDNEARSPSEIHKLRTNIDFLIGVRDATMINLNNSLGRKTIDDLEVTFSKSPRTKKAKFPEIIDTPFLV